MEYDFPKPSGEQSSFLEHLNHIKETNDLSETGFCKRLGKGISVVVYEEIARLREENPIFIIS